MVLPPPTQKGKLMQPTIMCAHLQRPPRGKERAARKVRRYIAIEPSTDPEVVRQRVSFALGRLPEGFAVVRLEDLGCFFDRV